MKSYSFSFSINTISITGLIFTLLLFLIGFTIVHLFKLMRMYLVVLEKNIPFKRFVLAYLRTTLVNLIIPFKLGEIYRVMVFSKLTDSFNVGLFSVLTDRFFDTLALIMILLPYQILLKGSISISTIMLTLFLVLLIFAYWMFPSSYRYLNRYIIMNRSSKRSMAALRGLEIINEWYVYVRNLVKGRYGLLTLFSFGAWIVEFLVLMGIGSHLGSGFTVADFGDYISSILSSGSTRLSRTYTILSIIIIAVVWLVLAIVNLLSKDKEQ